LGTIMFGTIMLAFLHDYLSDLISGGAFRLFTLLLERLVWKKYKIYFFYH